MTETEILLPPSDHSEYKPDVATAYDKGCLGCERTDSYIMLAFGYNQHLTPVFQDVFLDREQAVFLRNRLDEMINYNEETD